MRNGWPYTPSFCFPGIDGNQAFAGGCERSLRLGGKIQTHHDLEKRYSLRSNLQDLTAGRRKLMKRTGAAGIFTGQNSGLVISGHGI